MIKELEELAIELIEEEHGEYQGPDAVIAECGTDSFGVTMILLGINEEFPFLPEKGFEAIEFDKLTLNDIEEMYNARK